MFSQFKGDLMDTDFTVHQTAYDRLLSVPFRIFKDLKIQGVLLSDKRDENNEFRIVFQFECFNDNRCHQSLILFKDFLNHMYFSEFNNPMILGLSNQGLFDSSFDIIITKDYVEIKSQVYFLNLIFTKLSH